jgi:hypothetical protein
MMTTMIVLGVLVWLGLVYRLGMAFRKIASLEAGVQEIHEKLEKSYWTKEVIKRSLMRGPLEPDASSYEEWAAMRRGDKLYEPRCVRTLNDMLLRHNCGEKDIIAYDDPMKMRVGYSCECGMKWEMGIAVLNSTIENMPEIQADQLRELAQTSIGREKLGELLSTKRLKGPEELDEVDAIVPDEESVKMSFALPGVEVPGVEVVGEVKE